MPQQATGSPKGHSRVLQAYTRAIKKYDKALALDPSNKSAHYSKGVALLKLGHENESGDQVAESRWHFDKAAQLGSKKALRKNKCGLENLETCGRQRKDKSLHGPL